ncbi:MAG: hypothetical protein H5T47_01465 [Archaeoglobi archaeon]|nr:hypothetical protein [Candidatus Mnemosynella bozhongmuii]
MIFEECPYCGEEAEFSEIKEGKYQCRNCGSVITGRRRKVYRIDSILSDDERSERGIIELYEGEKIEVGEELVVEVSGELRVGEVRAIDTDEGRVERATAERIRTIWLRAVDEVSVPVSIHLGERTISRKIRFPGDEEIRVGDVIRIDGAKHTVRAIKRRFGKLVKEGGVKAKEIKRVYLK